MSYHESMSLAVATFTTHGQGPVDRRFAADNRSAWRGLRQLGLACVAATVVACVHPAGPTGAAPALEFIGEAIFPTGFRYRDFEVGGLSGIDYDAATNSFVAISDDRAQYGPVRFFDLQIDLSDGKLDAGDVVFTGVTEILDRNGAAFAAQSVDPESIRFSPSAGKLYWTSEGDTGVAPFVRLTDRGGNYLGEFQPPAHYLPGAHAGTRTNKSFESLTFSHDGRRLLTATENALRQDGPAASLSEGSPVRVLVLDARNGEPGPEYIYVTEPVVAAPSPARGFATNGLVELLSFDSDRLLALERSYSAGTGNYARLFLTATAPATDVRGIGSIAGLDIRPMPKRILFDLGELGIALDNIEGMTFGPTLTDGSRTLILVSDNNFNSAGGQFTQFLAFKLPPD